MATKRRKPSPSRLAKGLERASHNAERMASRLRELGFDGYAREVSDAARKLGYAQYALEDMKKKR